MVVPLPLVELLPPPVALSLPDGAGCRAAEAPVPRRCPCGRADGAGRRRRRPIPRWQARHSSRACGARGHPLAQPRAHRSRTGRSASTAAAPGAPFREVSARRASGEHDGQQSQRNRLEMANPRCLELMLAEAADQTVVMPRATTALTDHLQLRLRRGGRDRPAAARTEDQRIQTRHE